jgi:hypothetical protein
MCRGDDFLTTLDFRRTEVDYARLSAVDTAIEKQGSARFTAMDSRTLAIRPLPG